MYKFIKCQFKLLINTFPIYLKSKISVPAIRKSLQRLEWKKNVISRKDIDEFYELRSSFFGNCKIMDFADGTKVLDIGTGGGFPGIPLAILFPNTEFTLVDSIGKKLWW